MNPRGYIDPNDLRDSIRLCPIILYLFRQWLRFAGWLAGPCTLSIVKKKHFILLVLRTTMVGVGPARKLEFTFVRRIKDWYR